MEGDYKTLFKNKYEWFNGSISEEDLKQYQWEPNPLKILRTDIPMHMEADQELQAQSLKVEMQREKVEFVEAIIKSLTSRGFNIKNAIEWERFKMGG